MELEGKVALVTGSSRGIGRAIALRLARGGAAVAVNSATSVEQGEGVAREIVDVGGRARYYRADVADLPQVRAMLAATREDLGPVSILVNNSDWFQARFFRDDDPEHWRRVLGAKLMGSIHAVFAAYSQMRELGYGKIVSIAGDSGRVGITGGVVHSGAAAAIIAMTKSWAREFAADGIRVNAVSPGPTGTEMLKGLGWDPASGFGINALGTDLYRSELAGPLGVASPEDIAETVAFFASRRSDHITGQTLSVNGGRCFPS